MEMMSKTSTSRVRWRSALDFFKHKKKSLALGPDAAATIAPLLVAISRVLGIPARTCTAYPFFIDDNRSDYHCWCEVWNSQNGWQRVNLLNPKKGLKHDCVELMVTKRPSSSKQLVLHRKEQTKTVTLEPSRPKFSTESDLEITIKFNEQPNLYDTKIQVWLSFATYNNSVETKVWDGYTIHTSVKMMMIPDCFHLFIYFIIMIFAIFRKH